MNTRPTARKLLGSAARTATLVVVGVAETACNLQVSEYPYDPETGDTAVGDTDSAVGDTDTDTDVGDTDVGDTDTDGGDTDTDGGDTDTDGGDTDTDGGDTDAP